VKLNKKLPVNFESGDRRGQSSLIYRQAGQKTAGKILSYLPETARVVIRLRLYGPSAATA
jgi:hypothetical protein